MSVWCAFTATSIVRPFFFENPNGEAITVNGDIHGEMLNDYSIPLLNTMDLVKSYFQQDYAICHTTRSNMKVLRNCFPGKLISRFGDFDEPSRSPDLYTSAFILWGYLTAKIYSNKPKSLNELKDVIRAELSLIGQDMLKKVMKNILKWADSCIASGCLRMNSISFKN